MKDEIVYTFCELEFKTGVNRVVSDMSSYLKDRLIIFSPKYKPSAVFELNSRVFEVNLYNIWKMWRIVKKEGGDVILNPHRFDTIVSFALLKLLLYNRKVRLSPFIYDIDELVVSSKKETARYLKTQLEKLMVKAFIKLKVVDEILVLDDKMAGSVMDELNSKNVEVVRIGVSPSFVQLTKKVDLQPSSRLEKVIRDKTATKIFFQGILIPRRRLEDLIEAVSMLIKENIEVILLVGGSLMFKADYVHYIQKLVEDLDLKDRIYFFDTISEDELIYLYKECDIFVFPNDNQTWGLAPLEAMLFEKPAVVSLGCGVTEILNQDVAMLVPPRSPLAIKDAIFKLVKDDEFKDKMKHNAREYVLKKYTFSSTMDKLKELWKINKT